jgi:DNA-binding transcriptional ArsR family regulator
MADLLPSSADTSAAEDSAPRVIGLDSDDADDLLSALSSETARQVLAALHEEPTNSAALAEQVDTSLQNVQYHLGRLQTAGLVEVIDTVYSEKGREMKVYAPADRPLVVFAGRESDSRGIESALTRLLGAVGLLAALSAAVQLLLGTTPQESAEVTALAAGSAAASPALPPGLLFFLGGLAVIAVGGLAWYVGRARS